MVTTSKSMHREVQIKHDLMTHKCNGEDMVLTIKTWMECIVMKAN